jgi:hypothetical protein
MEPHPVETWGYEKSTMSHIIILPDGSVELVERKVEDGHKAFINSLDYLATAARSN